MRPAADVVPDGIDRLTLLLESTGEGVFGIDLDGRCTFVNRAGAQMLGWRTEEVLGRNMHALIHHSRPDGAHYPECECPIFNAFRRGLPCRIDDEVLWRADGSAFSAEYSSYPILDGGEVRGAVVTFVDISERKAAQALLQRTNDELERRVAERTRELRELANHLEAVRETERKRIAREIHDELGSLLVALKMDVNWMERRVGRRDEASRNELAAKCQRMGGLIDTAVDKVGRIITDLRPSILDHQGLWAALEWQAQEWLQGAADEIDGSVQLHVSAGVAPPEGGLAIAVFRIFQEVLSNVARHAQAKHVTIRLDVDAPPDPVLYLEVRDDGIGTTPAVLDDARSYGVMGMRERAAHFGGRVVIDSAPGFGTVVRLMMPLGGP
ncbi:PAS domain-containing sensor histidine kinase [Aquincola sp. S2]|uniref:PAS domain-containing sensor histidine kinase n=1 Tax=Pseudaquabacterium terrae TaxID=2732868 RepID=A0ABX2EDC4_9BURK|nr:PAS domain-containing sensor histidine kinase [Aquabacterium terrae]NRF66055.1 PAS domain-containing sensor histidine kinase [Aquabacterium terrae]